MAALCKLVKFSQAINKTPVAFTVIRQCHWNKDWKPAPYPRSPEEKAAAAKKYGLLQSEYQPYPDDGLGHGDYPSLPKISPESKDPYYPYDFPEHKRNLNEPLHVEADMYGEDRFNISGKPRYSMTYMTTVFLSVMTGFFALYFWLEDKKMFRPVLPKQYPGNGQVHYTFEPAE